MSGKAKKLTARDRWLVASRVAAAALGGYALTSAATVVLSLLWPAPKAQALTAASMLSFALYAAIVLWAFHMPSLKRLWTFLLLGTAVLSAAAWLLAPGAQA